MMTSSNGLPRFKVAGIDADRLEVTSPDGRLFTFPIAELQATRRAPRPAARAQALQVNSPLKLIGEARQAAEEYAILSDLI